MEGKVGSGSSPGNGCDSLVMGSWLLYRERLPSSGTPGQESSSASAARAEFYRARRAGVGRAHEASSQAPREGRSLELGKEPCQSLARVHWTERYDAIL